MTHRGQVQRIVGVAALGMLAWPQAVVAQSASGARPDPEPVADAASVGGLAMPLVVLTRENRSIEETTDDNAPGKVSRKETQSKRQVAVRLRTEVVHPMAQVRHATATYQPIYLERTAAEDKLHAVLNRPLPGPWELNETPLRDLRQMVADQFQIACEIDWRALEDAGLDLDTPLSGSLPEAVSLRSALRRLLGNIDLAHVVEDDTLLITTNEKANEHLVIGRYPLPTPFLVPERIEVIDLTDLIQSTVAAETWDYAGGPGAIRLLPATNELVISQTEEVHEQVTKLMAGFDADLGPAGGGASVALRFYPVRNPQAFADLQAKLVAVCNAALGEAADPAARVSSVAGKLVVQSASRPFHVYAAEVVRAVNGVEVVRQDTYPEQPDPESVLGMGGGTGAGLNPFCWVARAVYGEHDPRWLVFRAWLLNDAPAWLRDAYGRHGEWFAAWLRRHPAAKAVLRPLMDAAIAGSG